MIDPASIFVGRPIYHTCSPQHNRGMLELVEDRGIGGQYDHVGESSVSTARDTVVHYFRSRTDLEWFVWVDSDIGFSRQDWAYLMENQDGELAVCAEYLKKTQDLSLQVANFGLGFARIHRSVFDQLELLTRDDGEPRLLRYRGRLYINGEWHIEEMTEFHPVGVHPDGSRRNEDHGFWLMVMLAKIKTRIETRTKLGHTGDYTWYYDKEKLDAARAAQAARDLT
jgi:hypothetical protein